MRRLGSNLSETLAGPRRTGFGRFLSSWARCPPMVTILSGSEQRHGSRQKGRSTPCLREGMEADLRPLGRYQARRPPPLTFQSSRSPPTRASPLTKSDEPPALKKLMPPPSSPLGPNRPRVSACTTNFVYRSGLLQQHWWCIVNWVRFVNNASRAVSEGRNATPASPLISQLSRPLWLAEPHAWPLEVVPRDEFHPCPLESLLHKLKCLRQGSGAIFDPAHRVG